MPDLPSPPLDLNGEIWRFALDYYGGPGISDACLRLQDESGIDVVNLIIILYADTKLKRRLSAKEVSQLKEEMKCWREETVLPLRTLRRRLKTPPAEFPAEETEALRNLIKKAELQAEQIQLAIGERWLLRPRTRGGLSAEKAILLLREGSPGDPATDLLALIEHVAAAARNTAGRMAERST
ncbi:TIGR02444 family protein [Mesorhizobium sp. 1B3]|uniref:TIGR02444 family protein n=1 Tax=Mesorhizobium sp. 1B3 TaxID=3243599 RepID=UPI003D95421D